MPHEIFDTSKHCNPPLPLNTVTNKITFFRINVFEATLDAFEHYPDGRIDQVNNPGLTNYRMGIPLTDIFPHIRKNLKTKFLPDLGRGPLKLGIEGVFLPAKGDYKARPDIRDLIVFDDELLDGSFFKGIKGDIDAIVADLRKGVPVLFKKEGKLVQLKRPPEQLDLSDADITDSGVQTAFGMLKLTKEKLTELRRNGSLEHLYRGHMLTLRKAAPQKGRVTMYASTAGLGIYNPSGQTDESYFLVLGDILFDPRSGLSDKGSDAENVDVSVLSDDIYFRLLTAYRSDPRYNQYLNRKRPSDRIGAGQGKLPAYELGLYTSYDQEWELMGYSRGALINSITLAPKEEMTIEVFSFDRVKLEQEKEFSTEFEKNSEVSSMAKASSEISRDLTSTTDVNADIGLGIPLPIQAIPVNVDVNAGVSNQVKEGIQSSINHINEVTRNASEKFKSKTRVKVVQSRESGEENRVTRKISNANASRTLTLNYFELLETFRVSTSLKETRKFCLLVDNPDLGALDVNFVLAYEDRLQRALLSPLYLKGFDAAKILAAQRWFDKRSEIKQEIENATNGNSVEESVPVKPIVRIALNLKTKLQRFLDLDLLRAAGVLNEHYNPFVGENDKPSRRQVSNAEDELGLFNFWFKYKMASPGIESRAIEFVDRINEGVDENFAAEQLELFLTGTDDEWLTSVKMIAINLVAVQLSTLLLIPCPFLIPLFLELAIFSNDNGVPRMIDKAKTELKNYEMAQSAAVAAVLPATGSADPAGAVPQPPPQLFSLEELSMANAEFETLVLHLEANKTYYINKILLYEDSNQRYERLRIKGIAGYVENTIIGFVGNKTVFPLKMNALEPHAREKLSQEIVKFHPDQDGKADGTNTAKIETVITQISLPTAGVHVDSILGSCDALEPYMLDRREIEKQMAKTQAEMAAEKVVQQKLESRRLEERIKQGQLDKPF